MSGSDACGRVNREVEYIARKSSGPTPAIDAPENR